jgi:hypothetical protein
VAVINTTFFSLARISGQVLMNFLDSPIQYSMKNMDCQALTNIKFCVIMKAMQFMCGFFRKKTILMKSRRAKF